MKRVLIITYYWPPNGGAGVQRWQKMSKYLPQFGWQPVVYTPSNPEVITPDEALLAEVPSIVEVIKRPISEPYSWYKRLTGRKADDITLWNNFFDYDPDDFQTVINVNLRGSFFLAQAAARQMRQQGTGGRILFMYSVTGYQAIQYLSAYALTKAALSMLARQLVVELGPYGITVNAIAPGATVTPCNRADDPDYEAVWGRLTPTRRPAFPADIAQAALFLLSPQAAQINGQTLVVDGGWTATSPVPPLEFVEKDEAPQANAED